MERACAVGDGGQGMTNNNKPEQIHYCNTCKHNDKPVTQKPCCDCMPGIFGGTDRWERKEKQNENR